MEPIVESILKERYYQPGESSWEDIARRVANYIGNDESSKELYYNVIANKEIIPNSPCLMNAGTPHGGSLSACFSVPVEDSIDSIFDAVKACAKIHKQGGGTGISLSKIRSGGSPVKGTGHVACLTGDTVVFTDQTKKTVKKQVYTLDRLFDLKCRHKSLPKKLRCVIDENIIGHNELIDIIFNGEQKVYQIKTKLGYSIKATFNHRFMDELSNWKQLSDFKIGDSIAVNGLTATYGICKRCGREGRIRGESSPKYAGYCNSCATSLWGNHSLQNSEEHISKIRQDVSVCHRCGRVLPLRGKNSKYEGLCESCVVSSYHGCSVKGSEEYHKRMSNAQCKKWTHELKEKMRHMVIGPNNSHYKGDKASETTARSRIRTWYPDLNLSYCRICGKTMESGADIEIHHIDCNPYNNSLDNLQIICSQCHHKTHQQIRSYGNPRLYKEVMFDEIISIEDAGIERVFDVQMKYPYNNFIANGFVSHNSGPISFMRVFNEATETIKQGGKRRGANMGHLDIGHPDIVEFIKCKEVEGNLSNFNISVNITDEFMQNLSVPKNKEIFDLIVRGNWKNGEPGIIFSDRAEDDNACKHLGRLTETNPCSETRLFPWESCNLASINLMSCCLKDEFDWDKFEDLIRTGVRFLDDMIDKNQYPLPQIEEATKKTRKIGLGVMGFADVLISLGYIYGSKDSLDFTHELFKFMRKIADNESINIANIKGTYPASLGDPRRNAATLSIAPTGSISLFAGVSSGIEPNFGWVYKRSTWADGEKKTYNMLHPMFERLIKVRNDSELLTGYALKHGSIIGYDSTDNILELFTVAKDISPIEHIYMQATIQKYVDQAISKTVNCPSNTTEKDIADMIYTAWTLGCKGLTVYREGSRDDVVLETEASKKPIDESSVSLEEKYKRMVRDKLYNSNGRILPKTPRDMSALVCKRNTACGKLYVIPAESDNMLHSLFLINKGGCDAMTKAIAELIGAIFRWGREGLPVPRWEVQKICSSIRCPACRGRKDVDGKSCADIIATVLLENYPDVDIPDKEFASVLNDSTNDNTVKIACPKCGEGLIFESGCVTCSSCGYSRCG